MADVAAKTAKSDITKRSDVLRFAGKLLSVFFVVALLCAVLPTRATGEEPALFRASLMYNDTTNAAGSTILSTDCGDPADPSWEYAMAQYLHEVEEHGVSRDALRRMTQTLPAQLLGFENAAE